MGFKVRPAGSLMTILLVMSLVSGSVVAREVTVSAAASLTEAFNDIAREYQAEHPGDTVVLNFAASGVLLQQIAAGAPVDVFASADQVTMDRAQQLGLLAVDTRVDFASNALVLVVPIDSTLTLTELASLAGERVTRIAIGQADTVPAGRYARRALEAARVWRQVSPKTVPAQNVRQALDYVARREVDAALVYLTDAAIMPERVTVAFTVPLDVAIRYPVAVVATSTASDAARTFVAFLRSPRGQAILGKYGFAPP